MKRLMRKKSKGGRPPKVPGQKRTRVVLYLPEDLAAALDLAVETRRGAGGGNASRGDVVADALWPALSKKKRRT